MTRDVLKQTASCRLTREERSLVEAAAARAGYEYISGFMKETLMDRVRDVLGVNALQEDGGDGGAASG